MKHLIIIFLIFLLPFTSFSSRKFVSASSQYINLNTTLGNWEYTQAWSIAVDVKVISNASGNILGKQESSGNFRGWIAFHRAGASSPTYAMNLNNTGGGNKITICTTTEFATNVWRRVVFTYSGSGSAAGFHIRVDGVDQALSTIFNTLTGSTILNSVESQIGCRGGVGAPLFFGNCYMRRLLLYDVVLSGADLTAVEAGTSVPTTGLQLWQEFGPLNDGATLTPDWSGNVYTGFVINGATYSADDPIITSVTPALGSSGGLTLAGPLTKYSGNPTLRNLGWAGGTNNGMADQIGPGQIIKFGTGDYRAWLENTTGTKTLDVANQPGVFDNDTPTVYATSTDGYVWSIPTQDQASNAIFSVTNIIGTTAAFKAEAHAETSMQSLLYDPDDFKWKTWFHAGNNTGPRRIYYATCTGDPSGANWTIQNGATNVIDKGAGGSWEEAYVAAGKVLRRSSSLMVMLYWGANNAGSCQIGRATSSDRGLTWIKDAGNPIFSATGSKSWETQSHFLTGFFYDEPLRLYVLWYGSSYSGGIISEALGYAYSSDSITWTRGIFNPVACKKDLVSGQNNVEYFGWGTSGVDYFDGGIYRHIQRADNGVSGVTGFRGRTEADNSQIVKLSSMFFIIR